MSEFLIEDSETGFRVKVEGDSPPSETESEDIVKEAMSFLSKNLYVGPDNKYMLDVGPLMENRKEIDKFFKGENFQKFADAGDDIEAARIASKRIKDWIDMGLKFPGDSQRIDRLFKLVMEKELPEIRRKRMASPSTYPTSEKTVGDLLPNTLLLIGHGAKTGGLYTEEGHKFTLGNVAALLGQSSNSINNVINAACYGAGCKKEDYQGAFPNVTNIVQGETTKANVISLDRIAGKEYFYTNVTPTVWTKYGTNWTEGAQP